MTIKAIVFDAYGTLFDIYSLAENAEALFPKYGKQLAEKWRDKQIDYTRLRTLSGHYKPFWDVTNDALVFVCKQLKLVLNDEDRNTLMQAYLRLPGFSESSDVLQSLNEKLIPLAILSNGNPTMLYAVVHGAGYEKHFQHVISVDSVQKFKTAPEAYQLAPDVLGLSPKEILFVSSNCWDACGACWFGFTTFWINRAHAPLEELGITPHHQGSSLREVLALFQQS
jgi:2-haloacid dehalogenase